MNCCDSYGICRQGLGCPARTTTVVEAAHDKAAKQYWDASPPGYYEAIDAPGNLWDRTGLFARGVFVASIVLACALAAVVLVGCVK